MIELLDLMQKPLSLSQMERGHEMLAERIVAPPMFLSNDIISPSLLTDVRAMISDVLTTKQRIVIEYRFGLNEEGIVYEYHEIAAQVLHALTPVLTSRFGNSRKVPWQNCVSHLMNRRLDQCAISDYTGRKSDHIGKTKEIWA